MTEAIRQGDIPGVQLRRRKRFSGVGVEELWQWLTASGRLERWLAREATVEPGPSGSIELRSVALERPEVGDTVTFEPPRLWVLAFRRDDWPVATRLELEITRDAEGAELSVLQNGFEHLPLSDGLTLWEAYRKRWTEALDRLEAALAQASAGRSPPAS